MKSVKADLHIHTVLSPCANLLMTPGNIIKQALENELDIIAITDHNSAGNVEVTMKLAEDTRLCVIPGMEVESTEEVHLLCLFETIDNLLVWQEDVYNSLPDLKNDEDYFGYQLLTDIDDEYIAKEERLLATATRLTVKEIVERVNDLGGVVVPSHIDRPYNSIIANLGFIPPDLNLPVLEVSSKTSLEAARKKFPYLQEYAFIHNSDSHYLNDIKPMTEIKLEKVGLKELIDKVTSL